MKKTALAIFLLLIIVAAAAEAIYVQWKERKYWERPPTVDMTMQVNYRGKLLHDWTEALKSDDVAVRRDAAAALKEIPPKDGQYALGALADAAKDPDHLTRCRAAFALGRILTEVESTIPAPVGAIVRPGHFASVMEALNDPDPGIRREAAQALGRFGTRPTAAIPALNEAAKSDQDPEVRKAAATALEKIKPAKPASSSDAKGRRGGPDTKTPSAPEKP
jgi:hypothetical protein